MHIFSLDHNHTWVEPSNLEFGKPGEELIVGFFFFPQLSSSPLDME